MKINNAEMDEFGTQKIKDLIAESEKLEEEFKVAIETQTLPLRLQKKQKTTAS